MNHFDEIFASRWSHERLPILASKTPVLNSYNKTYDDTKYFPNVYLVNHIEIQIFFGVSTSVHCLLLRWNSKIKSTLARSLHNEMSW